MDPSWDQYGEDGVTARGCALDNLAVVRSSRDDRDTPREALELIHTYRAAYGDNLIASVQRVLHHVPPELPGRPDDAHPHRAWRPRRSDVAVNWPPVGPFVVCSHRFSPGHRLAPS